MAQKSKLFVGGLSQDATENKLYQTFDKFGKILDACIVYDKETGNSRGFGYVTFEQANDAASAMDALKGTRIDGKDINVEYANAKDPAKEAAKRMNRYDRGGRGGYPRGRGGPPRGRGGPPRGMGGRGGYPDRRPPPSRGYDGYGGGGYGGGGGGYGDQYGGPQRYNRDHPSERDGYGYGPPRRDGYDQYQQRPEQRRDGPPPPRRNGPPPPRDGYEHYPPQDRERYPPADRSAGGGGYHTAEQSSYGGDSYGSAPVDRYGGPPPNSGQRGYGRDW